ncbi:UNVERIFIED_ORG: hypothetical protein BDK47_11825 [Anoxybacillus amylolyticus]
MKKELKTFTVSVHERYRDEIARIRERESTARNFSEFVCEAILFYDRYKQVLEEQAKRLMGQWPLPSVSENEVVLQILAKQMQQTLPSSSSLSDQNDVSEKGESMESSHLLKQETEPRTKNESTEVVVLSETGPLKEQNQIESPSQRGQEKRVGEKPRVNKLARSLIF